MTNRDSSSRVAGGAISKPIHRWLKEDVLQFLGEIQCSEETIQVFNEIGIAGPVLCGLSDGAMTHQLGIGNTRDRKRIIKAIKFAKERSIPRLCPRGVTSGSFYHEATREKTFSSRKLGLAVISLMIAAIFVLIAHRNTDVSSTHRIVFELVAGSDDVLDHNDVNVRTIKLLEQGDNDNANDDGQLSYLEFLAMLRFQAAAGRFFDVLDVNDDGILSHHDINDSTIQRLGERSGILKYNKFADAVEGKEAEEIFTILDHDGDEELTIHDLNETAIGRIAFDSLSVSKANFVDFMKRHGTTTTRRCNNCDTHSEIQEENAFDASELDLFKLFDSNNDGVLSRSDVSVEIIEKFHSSAEISDGLITIEEFIDGIRRRRRKFNALL